MKQVEYDPKWAVCIECDGQGKFEDGQGQWWICRSCGGYGSPAARIYGEKHPDQIKPADLRCSDYGAIDFDTNKARRNVGHPFASGRDPFDHQQATDYAVEWSDIAASPWGDILYSVEADRRTS
jgi:hypothetical protein